VSDGIAQEQAATGPLRDAADLVVDTSGLPIGAMRRQIEQHFGAGTASDSLVVILVSFAYPKGLPREADLVFDARFLRNPHYDPLLRSRTGLDPEVGAFIAADPDFPAFFEGVAGLIELLLPRFVLEGKKIRDHCDWLHRRTPPLGVSCPDVGRPVSLTPRSA
jgi:UPF0042 nucleotide-binding protein